MQPISETQWLWQTDEVSIVSYPVSGKGHTVLSWLTGETCFDIVFLRIRFLESANSAAAFGSLVDLEPSPSHFPADRWVLKIEWLWSLTETGWLWRLIILIQTFPWYVPLQPFCSVCQRGRLIAGTAGVQGCFAFRQSCLLGHRTSTRLLVGNLSRQILYLLVTRLCLIPVCANSVKA